MMTDFNQQSLFPTPSSQISSTSELKSDLKLASPFYADFLALETWDLEKQLRTLVQEKAYQGDYDLAITLLDQLIALYPNNASDYNNRGLMHFRNEQIIEALCDLSQALAINPHLDSAYNNRANCHAAQGALAEAIIDYDIALDLNPSNLRAWINQGITFRELEMYDLALENFDIASIIGDSLQARIYTERGRTHHLQGDWNCAVSNYQNALEIFQLESKSLKCAARVQGWLDELIAPLSVEKC